MTFLKQTHIRSLAYDATSSNSALSLRSKEAVQSWKASLIHLKYGPENEKAKLEEVIAKKEREYAQLQTEVKWISYDVSETDSY